MSSYIVDSKHCMQVGKCTLDGSQYRHTVVVQWFTLFSSVLLKVDGGKSRSC